MEQLNSSVEDMSPPVTCRRRLITAPVIQPFDETCDISMLSVADVIVKEEPRDKRPKKDKFIDKRSRPNSNFVSQLPHPQTLEQEAGLKKVIVPEGRFSSTPFATPCSAVVAARRRQILEGDCSSKDETDFTLYDFDNLSLTGYDTDEQINRIQHCLFPVRPAPEPKKMICKVIVIGPSGAGKSSFIRQYIDKKFSGNQPATVGLDCFTAKVHYSSNLTIQLELWDIMGQDHYYRDGLTRPFYKNSSAAVLMFDVTDRMSFLRALEWKRYLDEACRMPNEAPLPCLLVGNKCDMEAERTVGQREVEATLAVSPFIGWLEVSSKINSNIEQATRLILDDYVKRLTKGGALSTLDESVETIKLSMSGSPLLDLSVKSTSSCC